MTETPFAGIADADRAVVTRSAPNRNEGPQAWKDALLDSYTEERHPIGARILEWTRAQVATMRPDPQSRALQAVLRDLIDTREGATYFAERVWGVSLRYDLGGNLDHQHPLVGRSCPDFELVGGTRPGTLLREGSGLLLVRPDGFVAWASGATPGPGEVTSVAARWFATRTLRSEQRR